MALINNTTAFNPQAHSHTPFISGMEGVLRKLLAGYSLDLRVCMPARVVKVRNNYRVDVQPLFQAQYLAEPKPTTLPIISHVPVAQPGGVNWQVKYPIDAGDVGFVIYADRAIDTFCAGKGDPADPKDSRTHDLTDAIYVPGLAYDTLAAERQDDTDDLVMRNGTAEVRLERNGTFRIYSGEPNKLELVDLIGQLAQQTQTLVQTLQAAMTVTMMGPQPFYGVTQSALSDALTKLTKITSSLGQLKGS